MGIPIDGLPSAPAYWRQLAAWPDDDDYPQPQRIGADVAATGIPVDGLPSAPAYWRQRGSLVQ